MNSTSDTVEGKEIRKRDEMPIAVAERAEPEANQDQKFRLKTFRFLNDEVTVCMQNENGPCPLLAIANTLSLRRQIVIQEGPPFILLEDLTNLIADFLLKSNSNTEQDELLQHTLNDVISQLPMLQYGMDVNVRFGEIDAFEFNSQISVFDMLGIDLYHGWIVSESDVAYSSLKDISYNQVTDRIIGAEDSEIEDEKLKASQMKDFLDSSQGQFTPKGLEDLKSTLNENKAAVFFRNNHFSTIFKHNGSIFVLLTDEGFTRESLCWEKLVSVDGNCPLVGNDFQEDPGANTAALAADPSAGVTEDERLARELQAQEERNLRLEAQSDLSKSMQFVHAQEQELRRLKKMKQRKEEGRAQQCNIS